MSKTKTLKHQSLEYYLNLRYSVAIYPDKEGGYTAIISDLPGCITQGETLAEIVENIEDARRLWIETAYAYGDKIPLPSEQEKYSGRLLLKMPKSLHQRLVQNAEAEGASLNQYILALLSSKSD